MQTLDHLDTVNLIGPRNWDSAGLVIKCHVIICNFLPNSETLLVRDLFGSKSEIGCFTIICFYRICKQDVISRCPLYCLFKIQFYF